MQKEHNNEHTDTPAAGVATGLSPSPFRHDPSRPSVFWASADTPYNNTRKALSYIDLTPAKNKRVLLKPNIGRNVPPETGATTHPQVIAAAIDAFHQAGAEVAVGESPITGVKMDDAFETAGIAAVTEPRNCPLLDMDIHNPVPFDIPDGQAINSLKVCKDVAEYDIIVSIPVIKTHMHTGVTLSVKNMKGCLWRRSKVDLHMLPQPANTDEKPLDIAITDMSSVLCPHLSIIDGTICMEGLGPGAGTPKPLGVVLTSLDAFAADAVACAIMGISAADVPHLRMAAQRGYCTIELDSIDISPPNWEDVKDPFALPPEKLSIEFEGFNILDKQSCSACQSTLLLLLKEHAEQLRQNSNTPADKDITIAIGKGHENLPEGTLCIGNCTAKHKNCGIFISGCPPVASEILKEYMGHPDD